MSFEETKFFGSKREQQSLENHAILYSNLAQLENFEKVNLKGCIEEKIYEEECLKLITRCKASFTLVTPDGFTSLEEFCYKYQSQFPLALNRIKEGKPIHNVRSGSESKVVSKIVSIFISLMDMISLGIRSVDELHPNLRDLHEALKAFSSSSDSCKVKVKEWFDILEGMKANEELTESEARQMKLDLHNSYSKFNDELDSR